MPCTPSIPARRVSSSLRIGNVAADDPVAVLELGGLAQGVVDGRVGEGGQEGPEDLPAARWASARQRTDSAEEVGLARAGRAPDQPEPVVEDPLERRELAPGHAVLAGPAPGPRRRIAGSTSSGRAAWCGRSIRSTNARIRPAVELGEMGQDLLDVVVRVPRLQQVGRPGPAGPEEPAGLQLQPEHGAGGLVGLIDPGRPRPAPAAGCAGAYIRSFHA